MRLINLFLSVSLVSVLSARSQQPVIKILETGKKISIRGLSVVNDHVIWASGTNGSVARSTDGNTFTWITVPGYEKRDFRDIEAFDENTAIIMGVAEPAVILKTIDGGRSWKKVFEDTTKGMFLDAMDFQSPQKGVVIGDPINNQVFMAGTIDGGEHWNVYHTSSMANVQQEGEAFFASSGTNIKYAGKKLFFVSGGMQSNIYNYGSPSRSIPIIKGTGSTGANSMAYLEAKQKGAIVGGDFTRDTISASNCVLFTYAKDNFIFQQPVTPPHGYRSCVIYLTENKLLTCGTSGIDVSKDGGMNWELISIESFHVCQKAKKGNAVFMAGGNGRIAKLVNP